MMGDQQVRNHVVQDRAAENDMGDYGDDRGELDQ
jgi:hypothetical protein